MTAMTHDAYVHSYSAAGQRYHRAQCRTCPWHGISSGDRERAQGDADDHATPRVAGRGDDTETGAGL